MQYTDSQALESPQWQRHWHTIRQRFLDGVLRVTLGQKSDVLSLIESWIQTLGDYEYHAGSTRAATLHPRTLLHERLVLLEIDDAWELEDVEPFLVAGPRSRVVIASREPWIAESIGAKLVDINVMTSVQSIALLRSRLQRVLTAHEEQYASDLARPWVFAIGS